MKIRDVEGLPEKLKNIIEEIDDIQYELEKKKNVMVSIPVGDSSDTGGGGGGAVNSVNGKTGTVILNKTDIGLGNVDNTSDLSKPISTLTQTALNLKANDNAVVKLTGNQTVAGVKTFSSSPIVPTPTTDYQAVTKKYVDDGNKLFTISLNFIDETVSTIKAPGSMKINSITAESGTPTIKVNGSAYTLGTSISQYDEIEVTATVDTLVILNSEKI